MTPKGLAIALRYDLLRLREQILRKQVLEGAMEHPERQPTEEEKQAAEERMEEAARKTKLLVFIDDAHRLGDAAAFLTEYVLPPPNGLRSASADIRVVVTYAQVALTDETDAVKKLREWALKVYVEIQALEKWTPCEEELIYKTFLLHWRINNSKELHLGFKGQFAGGELKRGYLAVLGATEVDIEKPRLWVKDDQLREGSSLNSSMPFERCDFMLLRFDVFSERDDWDKLTYIDEPLQQALDALQDRSEDGAKKADFILQTALRRVFKSPDLTKADQIRVVAALKEQYKRVKEAFGTQGLIAKDVSLLSIMSTAMSPAKALAQREPAEDDLLHLD